MHAHADAQGRPLGFDLTSGEVSDYSGADALIDLPVVTPCRLLADKGYDSDRIRENLLVRGILPIIPPRSNRTEDIPCNFRCSRDRNRIERMFNKLKQFRRIPTRYDKTRKSVLAFLNLAAVKLWRSSFVNRT
ncbi:IS5 family transposase [Gluconobacter cerinus]|uniref:IS5 family transposase n=1 Tax=Gluconobacter cerinus TaxID=38307 RepID=UPI003AB68145